MNTTLKEQTCSESIASHMASRLEQFLPDTDSFEDCLALIKEHQIEDDIDVDQELRPQVLDVVRERAGEAVLCVDWSVKDFEGDVLDTGEDAQGSGLVPEELARYNTILHKVCVGFGGPADYFEFEVNQINSRPNLVECNYIFQDWGDGARLKVSNDTALELAELWMIGGLE